MIDSVNNKELIKLHAKLIPTTEKTVSFSTVVNLVLKEGLKHKKRIHL